MNPTAPTGWLTNADGVSYPPAPWHLGGAVLVSAWCVPITTLPAALPPNVEAMSFFGLAVVGTAWAVYEPGGVLSYIELLAAVRVRLGKGRRFTITHIWVDHPSSIAGARALWGIPKQFARFEVEGHGSGAAFEANAEADGRPIASVRFRPRLALPGQWRRHARLVQPLADGLKVTRAQARARLEIGAAAWRIAPDGPLGFLHGRKPLLSARLAPVVLAFGI